MLFIIDLRILGFAFAQVPAARIAERLKFDDGFAVMVTTGLLLFFAIPVRSIQSIWLHKGGLAYWSRD